MVKCMKKCRRFQKIGVCRRRKMAKSDGRNVLKPSATKNLDRSQLARNSEGIERVISPCSSSSSCGAAEDVADIMFPSVTIHASCEDLASSSMCEFKYSKNSFFRREIGQNVYSKELQSPSANEIEEFFTAAEKSEKQRFLKRYNFDVDKDVPLEGRYEWVRIKGVLEHVN